MRYDTRYDYSQQTGGGKKLRNLGKVILGATALLGAKQAVDAVKLNKQANASLQKSIDASEKADQAFKAKRASQEKQAEEDNIKRERIRAKNQEVLAKMRK